MVFSYSAEHYREQNAFACKELFQLVPNLNFPQGSRAKGDDRTGVEACRKREGDAPSTCTAVQSHVCRIQLLSYGLERTRWFGENKERQVRHMELMGTPWLGENTERQACHKEPKGTRRFGENTERQVCLNRADGDDMWPCLLRLQICVNSWAHPQGL